MKRSNSLALLKDCPGRDVAGGGVDSSRQNLGTRSQIAPKTPDGAVTARHHDVSWINAAPTVPDMPTVHVATRIGMIGYSMPNRTGEPGVRVMDVEMGARPLDRGSFRVDTRRARPCDNAAEQLREPDVGTLK